MASMPRAELLHGDHFPIANVLRIRPGSGLPIGYGDSSYANSAKAGTGKSLADGGASRIFFVGIF